LARARSSCVRPAYGFLGLPLLGLESSRVNGGPRAPRSSRSATVCLRSRRSNRISCDPSCVLSASCPARITLFSRWVPQRSFVPVMLTACCTPRGAFCPTRALTGRILCLESTCLLMDPLARQDHDACTLVSFGVLLFSSLSFLYMFGIGRMCYTCSSSARACLPCGRSLLPECTSTLLPTWRLF
jgi:hypothetical protein